MIDYPHTKPKSLLVVSPCTICADRAFRTYLGVVVCPSCKMFFKRTAEMNPTLIKCQFGGHCNIDVQNRHACRSCRLEKCFTKGLQKERLRGSLPKTPRAKHCKESDKSPTLNLLRADHSMLSVEQWNLLSNLLHCYDEHSRLTVADRFAREQNALPMKMRYKSACVSQFVGSLIGGAQLLFEKNADFLSLSPHDRSLLLHGKLKYIGGLSLCLIVQSTGLFNDPAYCHTNEIVFGPATLTGEKRTGAQLDPDIVLVKLLLTMLLFSTMDYTIYAAAAPVNFDDVQAIVRIQDAYTELAWRYLIYKYDYVYAVRCFSKLLRCIFNANEATVEAAARDEYNQLVETTIRRVEKTFPSDY